MFFCSNRGRNRKNYPRFTTSQYDCHMNKDQEEEEKPLTTAVISYSQGLSEQIRRVLQMYNIRTAGASLGKLLTKVKDPVPLEGRPRAVYKFSCLCGDS